MLNYFIMAVGAFIGILACYNPAIDALDRLIDQVANPKD